MHALSSQQAIGTVGTIIAGFLSIGLGWWMIRRVDQWADYAKRHPGVFGTFVPRWFFRPFGVFIAVAGLAEIGASIAWLIWWQGYR